MYSRSWHPSTFHDPAVNRTDSSITREKSKRNLLLKWKAKFCLAAIHGGYQMLSYNRRTLAGTPCFCFSHREKGRQTCWREGYAQLHSSDTTEKTFMKHLGKDVLTHFRNAHLFLNTCAELT